MIDLRRRLLQESWAGLFRDHVLCKLPVRDLSPPFCFNFGRPTKVFCSVLGILILQQMKDLSDEKTMVELALNEQWHYALGITDTSNDATYMSPKTLLSRKLEDRYVSRGSLQYFPLTKSSESSKTLNDLADSLYGCEENRSAAGEKGTEVISPAMSAPGYKGVFFSDFTFVIGSAVAACIVVFHD